VLEQPADAGFELWAVARRIHQALRAAF
jgi:hypothetical protein